MIASSCSRYSCLGRIPSPRIFKRFNSDQYFPTNEPSTDLENVANIRSKILEKVKYYKDNQTVISSIIDGQVESPDGAYTGFMPSLRSQKLFSYSLSPKKSILRAIEGAVNVQDSWASTPLEDRCKIFLKAAHLVSTKYRIDMLVTTMLGQAKNVFQADIDAVCETVDFLKFHATFAKELERNLYLHQSSGCLNYVRFCPLEGFVAAISPFNFTAIACNLAITPALMGNVILWKPDEQALLSNHLFYKILLEAGLPPGVIQFVVSDSETFGNTICSSPDLAAINFTGSTQTFDHLWQEVAKNLPVYRNYPRLVGECGGKNIHFIHESANLIHAVNCTVRAAFEYSGQKCSACSRLFVPESLWNSAKPKLLEAMSRLQVGQPDDFTVFMSSLTNQKAFDRIRKELNGAMNDKDLKILSGGECDDRVGYFIHPTIIQTTNMHHRLMSEELFAPILLVYVYKTEEWEKVLVEIDKTSRYALTAGIFAEDRSVIMKAQKILKNVAGNLYINDKCTGAVVGQQPFGGSRKSGTNDKSGMYTNLLRFAKPITVKESFNYLSGFNYPYMLKYN